MVTHEEKVFLAKLGIVFTGLVVAAVATSGGGQNGLVSTADSSVEQIVAIETMELPADTYEADNLELVFDEEGNAFVYSYEMLPPFEPIVHVEFPEKLAFSIDPYEMNDRGQIFSDQYSIQNYSNVDVIVNVQAISYNFQNKIDFVSLSAPYDYNNPTDLKAIHMLLKSDNPDFQDVLIRDEVTYDAAKILLKASVYDGDNWVSFGEGSEISVYVTGTVSESPLIPWADDDVVLEVAYDYETVLPQPVMTAVLVPYEPAEVILNPEELEDAVEELIEDTEGDASAEVLEDNVDASAELPENNEDASADILEDSEDASTEMLEDNENVSVNPPDDNKAEASVSDSNTPLSSGSETEGVDKEGNSFSPNAEDSEADDSSVLYNADQTTNIEQGTTAKTLTASTDSTDSASSTADSPQEGAGADINE